MHHESTTLHDFTLNLLGDPDLRPAFQLDPEGVLHACGLSDITADDVHDILPLMLDTASVANSEIVNQAVASAGDLTAIDQLTAIAGNADGVNPLANVSPSAVTALVKDFSVVGDVSHTLDGSVLNGTEVGSQVIDLVHDNDVVTKAVDVVDVQDTADVILHHIDTDGLVKDVVDTNVVAKNVLSDNVINDVADVDVHHVIDVSDNVVQNVAQVGDVHNDLGQVLGDVHIGDIDVLNHVGNGLDLHF